MKAKNMEKEISNLERQLEERNQKLMASATSAEQVGRHTQFFYSRNTVIVIFFLLIDHFNELVMIHYK